MALLHTDFGGVRSMEASAVTMQVTDTLISTNTPTDGHWMMLKTIPIVLNAHGGTIQL